MKKVIIIGGGISGLSAGIYALKAGYLPLIIEKNPEVGGLCTGWNRKGRHIDGCIHWLTGTRDGNTLNKYWKELGALSSDQEVIYLPSWGSFDYEGTIVHFYTDLEKAEEEWINISPVDKKRIHHFFKLVRKIASVNLPLEAPVPFLKLKTIIKLGLDLIRTSPFYPLSMRMSCERFAKRFKHPALRFALTHVQPGAGNLYSMAFCYATMAMNDGGIPAGGSLKMVERIKEKYLQMGGRLLLNTEVSELIVSRHNIECVLLKDGDELVADEYITCCDANYVLSNLLKNKYIFPKIALRYNNSKAHPAPSCVLINYEIKCIPNINVPHSFKVEPFPLGRNKIIDHINIRSYHFDPYFVKDGKTILQVLLDQDSYDYPYWTKLRENKDEYNKFKSDLADKVSKLITDYLPELKDNITLLDVATPITLNRYVNASRGSYMGFLFNPQKGVFTTSGHISGIKNLRLAGQYVQSPGGLPLAMVSGKFAIDYLRFCELPFIKRLLIRLKIINFN